MEFNDLNKAQKEAVRFPFDKALKVTAGAGTGKTTVITFRFLEALKSIPGIKPENIACLTFTERAADSMRERITDALGPDAEPENLWVHTFHSFCARLLARHSPATGLPPGYRVAGEPEIAIMRDDIISSFISNTKIPEEERSTIPKGALHGVLRNSFGIIDAARQELHTPDTFEASLDAAPAPNDEYETHCSQIARIAARLFREFETVKYAAGVVDYADLISELYWLLAKNKTIRGEIRSMFGYFLVDEFQDTDRAQLELLRLLADKDFANVTVVGDDKQAIYEWRGARIENLREFPAGERFLTFNYRSFNEILDLANHSITRDPYFAPHADEIRLTNDLKGYSGKGNVRLVRLPDRDAEADYIADEIRLLLDCGAEPGEIAVLYRAKTFVKLLEGRLRRLGLPYTALGDGFYEREEIRDLVALLQLACDPSADAAAVRVLQRPPMALSHGRIASLRTNKSDPRPLIEMAGKPEFMQKLDPRRARKLAGLVESIAAVRGQMRVASLPVLVEMAFRESGYYDALCAVSPGEAARSISNVSKIVELAAEFQARSPLNGLADFVAYTGRLLALDRLSEAEADPQEETGAVRLLTVHRAKGLEFHTVFFADARVKGYRKDRQMLLDMRPACDKPAPGRVLVKYPLGSRNEAEAYIELLDRRDAKARHEQEERRITYVALTRARENLVMTTASSRNSDHFDELASEFASSKFVELVDMTTPAG